MGWNSYDAWGLDFVKVDDLSNPYSANEIEMLRKAFDKCGHPIVFSTSAGPTATSHAGHIGTRANMCRISGDFWDRWADLDRAFDLLGRWQQVGGPGHWPDADMIPFGHNGIRCTIAGGERQTRFSTNEQVMLMSLWAHKDPGAFETKYSSQVPAHGAVLLRTVQDARN